MDSKKHQMIEGVIWKQLILFFIPILLGTFFQQFYNMVDAIILGQFAGKNALAAIESTAALIRLILNLFVGISTGATIIISQFYGANNHDSVKKTTHTAYLFAIIGGCILTVFGLLVAPSLLGIINIPKEIINMSILYIRIYFLGSIGSLVYNIGAGILRAIGDSKRPFYFLVASCVLNIVLDYIFVALFHWNVFGVAFATAIAQWCSAILVTLVLMKSNESCRLILKELKIDMAILKKIFYIGIPIGLQSAMYSISNVIVQSSVNSFGTTVIAGWALAGKMDSFIWMVIEAFSVTLSTFVAQNYGAKNYQRLQKGVNLTIVFDVIVIGMISLFLFIFAGVIGRLFISDKEVIAIGKDLYRFCAPLYFSFVWGDLYATTIRATGESVKPTIITMIGTCLLRILWILLVVPFDKNNIYLVIGCYPITWIVTSLLFTFYYYKYKKQTLDHQILVA